MIKHIVTKALIRVACSVFAVTGLMTMPAIARPLAWGVNGPIGINADLNAVFQVLQSRGVTQYRVNADLADDTDPYEVQMYQDMVALAKLYGISLRPILFTPFAFGDRTDQGKYPAGDGDALYQQGYNRTYNFVRNFKQDINDWEMGNEINLLATDSSGNRLYGKGWTASEFDMPTMNDWAALLRGMSDAINRINAENHLHLRKTLNTTSTMFGFLDFMASKGVGFDIISYHYYELLGTDPHNYWGGVRPNFDLFKQLATYHRSVVFNEVNCAEIYNSGYENQAGQPVTETGFSSLNATLNYLKNQEDARIESVSIYELLDEPAKAAPENRFGLMYDISTPKVSLYLLSHFAGGELSPEETQELAKRGFLGAYEREAIDRNR
jgi:hypothetical protein